MKTMWLAKEPDGRIYGHEFEPERINEREGSGWIDREGCVPFYPDQLVYLFGDEIKKIGVAEDTPVKILITTEII